MPIVDGLFVPSRPLTPAEAEVDFLAHGNHVLDRRRYVEQAALPIVRRIVIIRTQTGIRPIRLERELAAVLTKALLATARFGFREARREIAAMRARDGVTAGELLPPAFSKYTTGTDAFKVIEHILDSQSHASAQNIVKTVEEEDDEQRQEKIDWAIRAADVRDRAEKRLHHEVLDSVGNSLNLGQIGRAHV